VRDSRLKGAVVKICFLSSLHPPYDKRVFHKEAVALAEAGFDVVHIAPDKVAGAAEHRDVRVVTFCSPGSGLRRCLSLPKLFGLALREQIDAVHCNELDSWLVGVAVGILRRAKVVFDVHEIYSGEVAERFPGPLRGLVAGLVRLSCRLLLPLTDRLVFAKKSAQRDFPRRDFPEQSPKYVLARNYALLRAGTAGDEPDSAGSSASGADSASSNHDTGVERDAIVAIHVGEISIRRGWPALLEALRGATANVRLEVIGSFEDGSLADFQSRVEELGLTDRVTVSEWLPYEAMMERLAGADVGLIAFQPGILNHTYALPHKLFDYMMAGLPVIAPDFAVEVAEIVGASDCGHLVDPSSPQEIAAAFDHLAAHRQDWRAMGARGREAALRQYNWTTEATRLVDMYKDLLGDPTATVPG